MPVHRCRCRRPVGGPALQLDENPLTVDGRGVNQSTLDRATTAALYTEAAWPVLASNLAQAEAGNGAGLLQQADDYEGRNADGTFNTLFQSIGIIRCASGMVTEPTDDPEGLLEKIREQAPRFGADVTLEDLIPEEGEDYDGCNELTGPAELVQIDYSGDGPIVVVGGKNDPATPYRWAEEMAAAMGPNARLLPFNGEGHGQLLASECVTEIEAALLTDLELPDEGIECNPDPKVEAARLVRQPARAGRLRRTDWRRRGERRARHHRHAGLLDGPLHIAQPRRGHHAGEWGLGGDRRLRLPGRVRPRDRRHH
jgi:hypothetical protein